MIKLQSHEQYKQNKVEDNPVYNKTEDAVFPATV